MPNHIINELIFRSVDAARQREIMRLCCNAESHVDFEILVPMPKNIWQFSVSSEHEKKFKRTALDWARENWGTKWNAYSHRPTEQTTDTLTMRFETAWAPPYPWLAALFNTLQSGFDHNWFDEGNSAYSGVFKWPPGGDDTRGAPWIEKPATEEMLRHLHKLHFGVEKFDDEDAA